MLTIQELAEELWPRPSQACLNENRSRWLVDVLGMDSRLMSTAEVGDEMCEHVAYLVGSEGFVPNTGWPYRYLLNKLEERCRNDAPILPNELCDSLVRNYIDYYRTYLPAGVSVDIAACDWPSSKT